LAEGKSSFCSSPFLQLSSRDSTGVLILPILKEQTRPKNDVWFIDFEKTCLII
jgi:hypothetical protein